MPENDEFKLIFMGQCSGDVGIERLILEYNLECYQEGFNWPGMSSGPSWDSPLLVLYADETPVGFVAISSSKWLKQVSIDGFYIKPAYRGFSFVKLLIGLKDHVLEKYPTIRYIHWGTHWNNKRVHAIAKRIGMQPSSVNYRMDLSTGKPDDPRVCTKGESITP